MTYRFINNNKTMSQTNDDDIQAVFDDFDFQEHIINNADPKTKQLYEKELQIKVDERLQQEELDRQEREERRSKWHKEMMRRDESFGRIFGYLWLVYLVIAVCYTIAHFGSKEISPNPIGGVLVSLAIPFMWLSVLLMITLGD